jgi:excisionase family DNA binding protein
VSRATLVRAIQKGRLKAFRVEGQWRILHSEVVRYLSRDSDEGR